MGLRPAVLTAEFFKWEPVSFGQAIGPAIFTIIAPGFTEEVSCAFLLGKSARARDHGSSWAVCAAEMQEVNQAVLAEWSNLKHSFCVCVQAIFRAALLPHPKINPQSFPTSAAAFAASAFLPLIIFVAYHLVRHRSFAW